MNSCPNCDGPISFTTTTCPKCGRLLLGHVLVIVVPIVLIILLLAMCGK